jgi:hypothetical protein
LLAASAVVYQSTCFCDPRDKNNAKKEHPNSSPSKLNSYLMPVVLLFVIFAISLRSSNAIMNKSN